MVSRSLAMGHLRVAGCLVAAVCAAALLGCSAEARGLEESCDEAMSFMQRGALDPKAYSHEFERIVKEGDVETRETFDRAIAQLRDVEKRGGTRSWEVLTPILDELVTACGLPVE